MMDESRKEERRRKRKERRKRDLIYTGGGLLVSILFLIVMILTGRMGIKTTLGITSVGKYDLLDIEWIEQEIRVNYNYLDGIYMFVVNVEGEQNGILQLELISEDGKRVFSRDYPLTKIEIGAFHKFQVNKFLKPGNYTLRVNYSGDVPEYGVPKVMAVDKIKNLEVTGTCYNWGEALEKNIALGYDYYQVPYGLWLAAAAVIPLFAFLVSDADCRNTEKKRSEDIQIEENDEEDKRNDSLLQ